MPRFPVRSTTTRRLGALAVATLLTTAGCHDYARVEPGSIATGAAVRVDLSSRGTTNLTQALGPGVRQLEGRLRQSADGRFVLSVERLRRRGEPTVNWTGESVTLASDDVEEVRHRTISRSRTAIAAASAAAVAIGTIVAIATSNGNARGSDGRPPSSSPSRR